MATNKYRRYFMKNFINWGDRLLRGQLYSITEYRFHDYISDWDEPMVSAEIIEWTYHPADAGTMFEWTCKTLREDEVTPAKAAEMERQARSIKYMMFRRFPEEIAPWLGVNLK